LLTLTELDLQKSVTIDTERSLIIFIIDEDDEKINTGEETHMCEL